MTSHTTSGNVLFEKLAIVSSFSQKLGKILTSYFAPLVDISLKLWIADTFFQSGLTKIQTFDTTILLFSYEYTVPLLSPVFAAYLATGAELILPVMLVLGLFTRFSTAGLFILNFVAAISYPDLSEAGMQDHYIWGMVLLVILTNRTHKLTLDYYVSTFMKNN